MCLQEATAAAAHLCGAEDGQANNACAIAAVAAPNRVASGTHNGRGTRRWARGRATRASAAASASSHARSWASSRTRRPCRCVERAPQAVVADAVASLQLLLGYVVQCEALIPAVFLGELAASVEAHSCLHRAAVTSNTFVAAAQEALDASCCCGFYLY